jgi:hypothetical protein
MPVCCKAVPAHGASRAQPHPQNVRAVLDLPNVLSAAHGNDRAHARVESHRAQTLHAAAAPIMQLSNGLGFLPDQANTMAQHRFCRVQATVADPDPPGLGSSRNRTLPSLTMLPQYPHRKLVNPKIQSQHPR